MSHTPTYYYNKNNSQLELDFVMQLGTKVFPIEVEAEENLQAKSLKTTLAENPSMHGLRFSMSDYRKEARLTDVPLYAAKAFLKMLVSQHTIVFYTPIS